MSQAEPSPPGQQEVDFTPPPNYWSMILRAPQKALQDLFDNRVEFGIHRNFIFTGIMLALATRLPDWLAKGANPVEVMIILLAAGPFAGLFGGYVFGAFAKTVSGWFGGKASKKEMRATSAWSGYPFGLAYGLFSLTYLICFYLRPDPVQKYLSFEGGLLWIPLVLLGLGFLFAMTLRWRALGYAQKAGFAQGLLTWILTFIFTYGPFYILAQAYFGLYIQSMAWLGG